MKHFALGLILGGVTGLLASFLKDENGQRIGAPLKENFAGLQDDAKQLKHGLNKAKKAAAELHQDLPAAKRAVSDIADDVDRYQDHTEETIDDIEKQVQKINKHTADQTKKD